MLCDEIAKALHSAVGKVTREHIGDFDLRLAPLQEGLQIGLPKHLQYERLYEALEERVQQLIAQQVEDAVGQCSRGLAALEVPTRALQDFLAGQHDWLMQIKLHVRDDSARSADAGEARRH